VMDEFFPPGQSAKKSWQAGASNGASFLSILGFP